MQSNQGRSSDAPRTERRRHPRLHIRLPVECRTKGEGSDLIVRTITQNVSTGGMYLELESADYQVGDRVSLEMTIPPRDGVSAYPGLARCMAEILRVRPISPGSATTPERVGIAARFLDRLTISY